MSKSITALLLFFAYTSFSQVTSVKYEMVFNEETSFFDCYLHVEEGSANTLIQRIQFNSQISIVVPSGSDISVAESYFPLVSNQNYDSNTPMPWQISNKITSPPIQPENDYIAIIPLLSPTALYNDMAEGDKIKLFSLDINGANVCPLSVRVFRNGEDPMPGEDGMQGGDFRNGFTIGGTTQVYNGNVVRDILEDESHDMIVDQGGCISLNSDNNCFSYPVSYNWSNGETSKEIEVCPEVTTTYSLKITDGLGNQMTVFNTVEVETMTTSLTSLSTKYSVSPNPTSGYLDIAKKKLEK